MKQTVSVFGPGVHLENERVDARTEDIYQAIRVLQQSQSVYVNIEYHDGPVPAVRVQIFGTPTEVLATFKKGKRR